MNVFAAHNMDDVIRRESSAGGVFTQLAEHVIAEGGVVYGAAFDACWNVTHCRVDNIRNLAMLRGSKYVYSKFAPAITDAVNELNNVHKVLFSGTPCQVAAMRKRVGENPNLLLVEVVCHGAPEAKYWIRYLKELCAKKHKQQSDIQSINFRDKRTGWKNYSFTVTFKDGNCFSEPHDDNLFMRAFLADFTIRDACFRCPFKYPNGSHADITIGDFWGISQLAPDLDNDFGTTIIVARTDKGRRNVEQIKCLREFKFEDMCRYNPALVSSPSKPTLRSKFVDDANTNDKLMPVLKKYAKRPLSESIYLYFARLYYIIKY